MHRNVIIIGSGPAGCTAAIYAARAGLKPLMIAGMAAGGQLTITTEVENYPGFAKAVMGPDLMQNMLEQAVNCGADIVYDDVINVNLSSKLFKISDSSGNGYTADSVIISTGGAAKWLGLESEKKYQGYGVSGCATCDGVFFKDKDVLVVGGGNTAVEEALYLTRHCKSVTLMHRRDRLRAEKVMQDKLFANSKVKIIWNHNLKEVLGKDEPTLEVTGALIENSLTKETEQLNLDGVFIAIGHKPNTSLFNGYITLDQEGYIITNSAMHTNIPGVFACGDVQDKIYRQAVTAAGSGCIAALEAIKYIEDAVS